MAQSWERLLFAHWAVDPAALESVIPPELPLDTLDGKAWVAVTPFEVKTFRLRLTVPMPVISSFPEVNVRTYVTVDGRPGIYFFSLDTCSRLAVAAARRTFRLPYFHADQESSDGRFTSSRTHSDGPPADFSAEYRPVGEPANPRPGTLEHFLTERYCLYTLDDKRRVHRGEIHHRPWPLQPAEAEIDLNTMGDQVGIDLSGPPVLHYSGRQDVVFWQLAQAADPQG